MELGDLDHRESTAARALDLLQAGKARAYDKALSTLNEDTRDRWNDLLKRKPSLGLLMFEKKCGKSVYGECRLIRPLQSAVSASLSLDWKSRPGA
jgi:hypothetical protein